MFLGESTAWVVQIFWYVYPMLPANCLLSAAQKPSGQHWRSGRFNLSLRQLEKPKKPKQHLIVDGRLGVLISQGLMFREIRRNEMVIPTAC